MKKDKFINSMFIMKNYPTVAGVNSEEGKLHILVSPTAKDDSKVRINLITQNSNGETIGTVICLITQETAALIAYQMNLFLRLADNVHMDQDLFNKVEKQTEEWIQNNMEDPNNDAPELEVL